MFSESLHFLWMTPRRLNSNLHDPMDFEYISSTDRAQRQGLPIEIKGHAHIFQNLRIDVFAEEAPYADGSRILTAVGAGGVGSDQR